MSYKLPQCLLNPYANPPLAGRQDINDYLPPTAELLTTQNGIQLTAQSGVDLTTQGV